jgi:hypothetical protein
MNRERTKPSTIHTIANLTDQYAEVLRLREQIKRAESNPPMTFLHPATIESDLLPPMKTT